MTGHRRPQLKKFNELAQKSATAFNFDDDRAIADFRAFYSIAIVHTARVTSIGAIEIMEEVFNNLQNDLQARKKVLELA